MKVLIVSDTHGRRGGLDRVLEAVGQFDMFIHLGDVEGGEDYLNGVIGCEKHMVRGNCDFFSELPREEEFYIGPYKVFITHGHYYFVSMDVQYIKEEGLARGAAIIMFGHTHKPCLEQEGEVTVLNPGSVAFPRQEGRKGSYMVMEVARDGTGSYRLYCLEPDGSSVCVHEEKIRIEKE